MTTTIPRPPFDPELEAVLSLVEEQIPHAIPREAIPSMREATPVEMFRQPLIDLGIECRDIVIPGYEGAELVATVLSRAGRTGVGPGIYHTHGGGMIIGNRLTGILEQMTGWILEHDAVMVTVEYRLAPEYPDPYPVEDCYAGLLWTFEHAEELGIDPSRVLIAGGSAGGGLAAGVSLLARDRKGPKLLGQVLVCPMIDDRNETVSSHQVDGIGSWDRLTNIMAWGCLLGDKAGSDEVSIYAAPARATDLSGLPPAFIDCGSVEVFRDEDVAYASKLWEAGVQAELHVWPGGFHGFDGLAPHAAVSQGAHAARNAWVARMIGH